MSITDFEQVRGAVTPDQVLTFFGYDITPGGKVICPFHAEEQPSMQLYAHDVYCFGCKIYLDVPALAKALLEKERGQEVSYGETLAWFGSTTLPEKTDTSRETVPYSGPVPLEFIQYWHSQMTEELYTRLAAERLITKETAQRYQLGWRADWEAWTIPFWRGVPGNSLVDIVQFRLTNGPTKYIGLKGHNRGSVQNAYLLDQHQPYIVILFGSYDAILALQDGVIAVGFNGSMPFKKTEKAALQRLFSKQDNIFVVPDNTPSEYEYAYVFEQWLGARVRYFPADLPGGTDYIDYRKSGCSAFDFKSQVLCMAMHGELISNVGELLSVGDPYGLAKFHADHAAYLSKSPSLVVHDLLHSGPFGFTEQEWNRLVEPLKQVESADDLFSGIDRAAKLAYALKGGW